MNSATKTQTPDELTAIYDQRIQDGMRWLDENVPGWEPLIKLPQLDLGSGLYCIVGQAEHGLYMPIKETLEASDYSCAYPPELGFEVADTDDVEGWDLISLYRLLTDRWIMAITARRQQAVGSD